MENNEQNNNREISNGMKSESDICETEKDKQNGENISVFSEKKSDGETEKIAVSRDVSQQSGDSCSTGDTDSVCNAQKVNINNGNAQNVNINSDNGNAQNPVNNPNNGYWGNRGNPRGYFNNPDYERRRAEYYSRLQLAHEKAAYKQKQNYFKSPLVLSLIGLICDIFCGLGMGLSIAGLIMGALRNSENKAQTFKWAIYIGIIGAFLGFAFLIITFVVLVKYPINFSNLTAGN